MNYPTKLTKKRQTNKQTPVHCITILPEQQQQQKQNIFLKHTFQQTINDNYKLEKHIFVLCTINDIYALTQHLATTSYGLYAGPVTKHPLIQKYLYWPMLRSNNSNTSPTSTSSKHTYDTFKDSSDRSTNKDLKDINKQQDVSSNSSSSSLSSKSSSYKINKLNNDYNSALDRYNAKYLPSNLSSQSYKQTKSSQNEQKPSQTSSSISSRLLASGRTFGFGKYNNHTKT